MQEVQNIPAKFYSKVQKKYGSIDHQLSRKSVKYLEKLQKQENRISRKLSARDSLSNMANGTVAKKYESFIQTFKNKKEKSDPPSQAVSLLQAWQQSRTRPMNGLVL